LNFSEIRLPHTTPNFDGACGIHLFVEFDFDVAPIQFLIINIYLNYIDISINTKNYASRKPSVLKNVVNRRQFSHSGTSTQSLTTKKTETAEILRSIIIGKNYKNSHIFKSKLQVVRKISRATTVITDIEKEDKKMIKNIDDNEEEIYKIEKIEKKIYKNKRIEKEIRGVENKSENENQNEMEIEI
jgi:hypothetical protein